MFLFSVQCQAEEMWDHALTRKQNKKILIKNSGPIYIYWLILLYRSWLRLYIISFSRMPATHSLTHGRGSRQYESHGSQASVQVLCKRPRVNTSCMWKWTVDRRKLSRYCFYAILLINVNVSLILVKGNVDNTNSVFSAQLFRLGFDLGALLCFSQ